MRYVLLLVILLSSVVVSQKSTNLNWQTKFEESNYLETSNYDESIKYFQMLADNSEYAKLITIGISPQGREIKSLIVSKAKIFNPAESLNNKYAKVMINNGIHSGEIEGKDASMLMLRDMLVTLESKTHWDNVILLVIPVSNLDGHERSSKYNRINQNGPTEMGFRTTAQNYNLNRDFAKADTPEMKALLKLFREWRPDIFIDTHTTNGADYQYTITYAASQNIDVPPATRKLVKEELLPYFEKGVEEAGYLIAPYVSFVDKDYKNGISDWIGGPRYSNSYAGVQNRIGVLIETHMLKPYKDRVFGTKAMLESVIDYASKNHNKLIECSALADKYVVDKYYYEKQAFPIKYITSKNGTPFIYKGIKYELYDSKISGSKIKRFTGEKYDLEIPYYSEAMVSDSVYLPEAYIIPKEWSNLIEILELHGIKSERLSEQREIKVEKYKFKNVKFSSWPYESRMMPSFNYDILPQTLTVNKGDYWVSCNQTNIGMIAYLLEPKSDDSFVKWGSMNIIFEKKEYFEDYSMEPIAKKMYDNNEELRNEFLTKLESDSTFAKNPKERLNFFYERSPYYDNKLNYYPILRVLE